MRYAFIDAEKATETSPGGHSVALMCRVLGVSRSGMTPTSPPPGGEERARLEEELVAEIRHIHDVSGGLTGPEDDSRATGERS